MCALLSLAVRIPNDETLQAIFKETGPLVTSSANQPDQPPATTIDEAKVYFGDDVSRYEDGGRVEREPSTVIQVIDDATEVVHQGAVKSNRTPKKLLLNNIYPHS